MAANSTMPLDKIAAKVMAVNKVKSEVVKKSKKQRELEASPLYQMN